MFIRLFDYFYRNSAATLVGFGFLFLLSCFSLSMLRIELDLYGQEIAGFPSTKDHQEQRVRYRDSNSVVLLFSAGRPFLQSEFCKINDWLTLQNNQNPEVLSVTSPLQIRAAKQSLDRVWYPPYLKINCDTRTQMPIDLSPLLETPWRNVLTDRSAQDLGVEISFRDTQGTSRFGRFDPIAISHTIDDAETFLRPMIPELKIFLVGPSAFQLHVREALLHDFALQGLIFLLFLLVFRYFFGTWLSGLFFLSTLVVTLIIIYGAMGATKTPLNLMTNNLSLMTAIAAVEDFLFVAVSMKIKGYDWQKAMRIMIAPCFFTTLTTVVGFFSLNTSDIEIIGTFGTWAGVAALMEWMILFLVCPAIIKHLPVLGQWVNSSRAANINLIRRLANLRTSRVLHVFAVFLFIGGIIGLQNLYINDDPTRNFSENHINTKSFDYLETSRGWRGAATVVFEQRGVYRNRIRIEAILAELEKEENVAAVMNPFLAIGFAGKNLPPELKAIAENDVQATPLYRRLFSGDDQARSTIYFKNADLKSVNNFVLRVNQLCSDGFCRVAGQSAVYMEFSKKIVPTLLSSFGWSIAIVVTILLLLSWYLKVPNWWAVVFSAIWGPIAMMGIIGLFQVPISLITSLFAAVIVGLTGDNAIQYLFAAKEGNLAEGLKDNAEASVLLSFLLAFGSLIFLLQSVKPMKILGVLFFIGFIMNLAGDLWLLKGLLPAEKEEKPETLKK